MYTVKLVSAHKPLKQARNKLRNSSFATDNFLPNYRKTFCFPSSLSLSLSFLPVLFLFWVFFGIFLPFIFWLRNAKTTQISLVTKETEKKLEGVFNLGGLPTKAKSGSDTFKKTKRNALVSKKEGSSFSRNERYCFRNFQFAVYVLSC